MRLPYSLSLIAAALLVAACGTDVNLAPASIPNVVDTFTIGSLRGSPVSIPSAYSVADGRVVRTDITAAFDFAYNVEASGRHAFLTLEVMRLSTTQGSGPGLQYTSKTFDQLTQAPSNDWITGDTIVVDPGTVLLLRSRIICGGLGVPLYGKLEVLSINDTPGNQTITFKALSNENCGYKSLAPGLPRD